MRAHNKYVLVGSRVNYTDDRYILHGGNPAICYGQFDFRISQDLHAILHITYISLPSFFY